MDKCELFKSDQPHKYFSTSCGEVFPFQEISDNELVYENSSVEETYETYKLMDICSKFNLNSLNYSDCSPHNFGNDIDPNKNFYNNISKCKYYTDLQLNEEIGGVNGLSFIHFNARSLKTNFHKIKDYILELNINFDIIAITETWIEPNLTSDFNINNYDAFHITRGTRRGGGVAIYTNKKLSGALAESKSFVIENILECVTVELTIKNHTNVVVSCIYRTPGSPIDTFCENLERNLSDVKSIKTIFVCGDFNIDLLKHETHNNTKHFLDTMYSLGLYPLIDKPTRITDNSTTLIDNIFTNELRFNLISGIMYNDISDHLPIFALCEYNISRYNVKEFQFIRKVNEDTMASLSNELILQTWENVLKTDDVNQAYDSFLHIFMDIFNKHCPVEKVTQKSFEEKKPGSPTV